MTADPVGGVWTYALDLCRAFQGSGIQVCLATMGARLSATQRVEVSKIPGLKLRESDYKLEWMDDPWEDVARAGAWLLELEREVEPDVIHMNGYTHAALKWSSPVVVVAHSCVLSWWQGVKNEPAPPSWNEYRNRVAQGLKAADAVVSISNTYAAELDRLYGPIENMSVIYNGRDAGSFYAGEKKKQVFAMGRIWDEAKNLTLLSKLSSSAQLPVLIAGDNTEPNTGEPVEIPNVRLLGKLSPAEIRAHLAASYFYVLPAKYEPFGLSVLEAALSGCVLLLADNPTLKELWQDAALYFNPDRPEELDQLLLDINNRPELGAKFVTRSLSRAKLFSLDKMARNYMNLYQYLVQTNLVS
jgi:glycosyltransferase involved in cell wall biosynthesis